MPQPLAKPINNIQSVQREWLDKLQQLNKKDILIQHNQYDKWHSWNECKERGCVSKEIHTRSILSNEILIEGDHKDWHTVRDFSKPIAQYLNTQNIPRTLSYSGGKSIHISILIDPQLTIPDNLAKPLLKYGIDVWNAVRQVLTNYILENANPPHQEIMDWRNINWSIKRKGSMVRILGCRRDNGNRKTLIDSIPHEKPQPQTTPLNLPSEIKMWDIEPLRTEIIDALKLSIRNIQKYEIKDLRLEADDFEKIPCCAEIMKGMPVGKRHLGLFALTTIGKSAGILEGQMYKILEDYGQKCENASQFIHRKGLQSQIKSIYESDYHASCKIIQQMIVKCDSNTCSIYQQLHGLPLKIDIPSITNIPLPEIMDNVYLSGESAQIFGTTRSRKTTEAILGAIRNFKRTFIIVPRLRILNETLIDILKRADENNKKIFACYLPDNKKSCLWLKKHIRDMRELHGAKDDEKIALETLRHLTRPKCRKCTFFKEQCWEIEIVPNKLYGEADIENLICGYQTVIKNSDKWDLVCCSDKKFICIVNANDPQYITPLGEIIADIDVFILDEISHFLEYPAFEIDIWKISNDKNIKEYKYTERLKKEVEILRDYVSKKVPSIFKRSNKQKKVTKTDLKTLNELQRLHSNLTQEININTNKMLIDENNGIFVYKRDITSEEMGELRDSCKLIHSSIELKAKVDNEALTQIEDMLDLSLELEWIFTNVPIYEYEQNISIKIAPKVIEYTSQFYEKQIITLDATPSIIDIEKLFDKQFQKYNIGDPQKINDKFIIIPDTLQIYASKRLKKYEDRLSNWINWTIKLLGEENIGLLFTSIAHEKRIMERIKDKFPKLDYRHHRGTKTFGVPCDRRIGITICPPYAPQRVMHWLKKVYPEQLKNFSSDELWKYEETKQVQQGDGRFKDPQGQVRSGVIAFGQTKQQVEQSYFNAILKPEILNTIQQRGDEKECPIEIIQMALWFHLGEKIDDVKELKTILQIIQGKNDKIIQDISKITIKRLSELRYMLNRVKCRH